MKLIAYDPYAKPDLFQKLGVERSVTLNEMLDRADVLRVNAILTDETRHIIGEDQLRRMKKTVFIINTSRGEIIDEKALLRALQEDCRGTS